jgi:hypothetical protein
MGRPAGRRAAWGATLVGPREAAARYEMAIIRSRASRAAAAVAAGTSIS